MNYTVITHSLAVAQSHYNTDIILHIHVIRTEIDQVFENQFFNGIEYLFDLPMDIFGVDVPGERRRGSQEVCIFYGLLLSGFKVFSE